MSVDPVVENVYSPLTVGVNLYQRCCPADRLPLYVLPAVMVV